MRVTIGQLRRIIRETLEEEGWPPGRWYPGDGEPVEPEETELMTTAGLGREEENAVEALARTLSNQHIHEASLTIKGLKKSSWAEMQKKFPDFAQVLETKFGKELSTASFAVIPQGMFGMSKIPLMVTKNYSSPVVYWEDDNINYNSSSSLADAIRNLK